MIYDFDIAIASKTAVVLQELDEATPAGKASVRSVDAARVLGSSSSHPSVIYCCPTFYSPHIFLS